LYLLIKLFHHTSYFKTLTSLQHLIQLSHHINRVAFGDYFPGVVNPLDRWALYVLISANQINYLSCLPIIFRYIPTLSWLSGFIGRKNHQLGCISILLRLVSKISMYSILVLFCRGNFQILIYIYLMNIASLSLRPQTDT
jgi:hypothetical protein